MTVDLSQLPDEEKLRVSINTCTEWTSVVSAVSGENQSRVAAIDPVTQDQYCYSDHTLTTVRD